MIRSLEPLELQAITRPRGSGPEPGWSILVGSFLKVALPITVVAYGIAAWIAWKYPYGHSHCCIQFMRHALEMYAMKHGRFPSGEATPEASLSLLYHDDNECGAGVLRGKTVPLAVVERILNEGGLLGPDTCGWHYVEGLSPQDDRRFAILWDKVGLGHNGQRLSPPGREVLFVGGEVRIIRQADWPTFLAEQERLHAERRKQP
ncbi:MAG: hypothetical protein JNM56_12995 [Planctomycetia bacterium]|nr:hypothetical protein [Planctomycetia bacterium]